MIARLYVFLPFSLPIPQGETFKVFSFIDEGYEIRFYPMAISEISELPIGLKEIKIDEVTTICPDISHDIIHIDFYKDNFDRRKNGACDPPYELIKRTVNSFLSKLRFVTRINYIKPVDFPNCRWDITYLNDDGTELKQHEGLTRLRGMVTKTISLNQLNSVMWEEIHKLPPNYSPPEWDSLLLDANFLLPEVGPSIVLAMTALEVFISQILNTLAEKSSIHKNLWEWINNRDWWLKEPAVEEQFDVLLQILVDTSLKADNKLWEAFAHLRRARNSFVHDGVAKVGDRRLTLQDAYHLVKAAADIIGFVRELLPDEMRWPQFHHKIESKVLLKIL